MARKKLRTIGKRVLRELERKLPQPIKEKYKTEFENYNKALRQEQSNKDKFTTSMSLKRLVFPKGRLINSEQR